MHEACPRKYMIFGIVFLTLLTIVVLVIESRWATENKNQKNFVIENNSTCWLREEYFIIEDCHPCTAFEIASKSLGVCVFTHNKEVLRCKSGEIVSKSCDKVAWIDNRKFWIFEFSLLVTGLVAYSLSILRQKSLDVKTSLKIQRQIHQRN